MPILSRIQCNVTFIAVTQRVEHPSLYGLHFQDNNLTFPCQMERNFSLTDQIWKLLYHFFFN